MKKRGYLLFLLTGFFLLSFLGQKIIASQKCHNGNPLEFTGKYWLKNGSNVMNGFQFTSPQKVNVGKGFSIRVHPKVPYRITMGINLIVYGPGLPSGGKVVNFNWANNQSMGMQTIKCKQGASEYTFEFYGGSTIQPGNQNSENQCSWVMCFDGPFEVVKMNLPKFPRFWEINFEGLFTNLKRCNNAPRCDFNTNNEQNKLKRFVETIKAMQVGKEIKGFYNEVASRLEEAINVLREVSNIIRESNRVRNREEKREIRKNAMEQLKMVQRIIKETHKMIREFINNMNSEGERR